MTAPLRKFVLTIHVVSSVGWLGAVIAYLALAITGVASASALHVRSAYVSMEAIGWFAIVPLCLVSFVSGLVQSLCSEWGLVRHWWVVVKFGLTTISTVILLLHMPVVSRMAAAATEMTLPIAGGAVLRTQLLVHAAAGLCVLVVISGISIFKPWSRTPFGSA